MRVLASAAVAVIAVTAVAVCGGVPLDLPPPVEPATVVASTGTAPAAQGRVGARAEKAERSAVLTAVLVGIEDAEGQPVGGCHVRAMHRATEDPGGGVREGISDANGVVRLSVPPADQPYLILANWAERYLPQLGRAAASLEVRSDPVESRLALTHLDSRLLVAVVDDRGEAVVGWPVHVNHEDRVVETDRSGAAYFEHLPAGDRAVDLGTPASLGGDLVLPTASRQTVCLVSQHQSIVQFVVERHGSLVVTLPDRCDGFAGEVTLRPQVQQPKWGPRTLPIAAGGTATFVGLRPGDYWLTATCGPAADWNCRHCDRLVVRSGEQTSHPLRVERLQGTLAGTVVDADGRGVAGAPVWAFLLGVRGDRLAAKHVLSGADGRFELRGIPEAELRCLVDVESIGASNYRMFRRGRMPFLTLPGPTREVVLGLEPGHRLVGRVLRKRDGKPLAGEPVYLQHVDWSSSRRAITRHDQERPRRMDSALDVGWFEFGNLEPGAYEVWCGEGAHRAVAQFSIAADGADRAPGAAVEVVLHWEES